MLRIVRYGSGSNEGRGTAYAPYTAKRTGPFEPMSNPTSAKKATLELVERMEEDVTFEDIMYELHVLQKIERGRRDAEEGRTTPHGESPIEQHLRTVDTSGTSLKEIRRRLSGITGRMSDTVRSLRDERG
jgi:hypothetical protein